MSKANEKKLRALEAAVLLATEMLAEWLIDNTEKVYEEQPEIDTIRGNLLDALEELGG
jgi:hypothetical protein